jgi:hypothetical protein
MFARRALAEDLNLGHLNTSDPSRQKFTKAVLVLAEVNTLLRNYEATFLSLFASEYKLYSVILTPLPNVDRSVTYIEAVVNSKGFEAKS